MNPFATQPTYILHARSFGVAVCAGINGSTTLVDDTGEGKSFYRPINEWILPEKNLLTGLVFQPPGGALPDGSAAGGPGAYVHLELLLAGADGLPNTAVPALGEFHWSGAGPITVLPAPVIVPTVMQGAVNTRLWSEAEVVETLEDTDRTTIVALVNELMQALANQSTSLVLELLDYRFDDEARARAQDASALKSSAMNLVQNFAGFEQLPRPLVADVSLFTPAAAGRAWHVQRGWMKPSIVFENDDQELSIEVYASRINGRWVISRG